MISIGIVGCHDEGGEKIQPLLFFHQKNDSSDWEE